ncbi:hypothetical protein JHW43_003667 [Diplocarpon mali]|nr:hypothetical protein JHW43_003667 [Diplocarpon mali]
MRPPRPKSQPNFPRTQVLLPNKPPSAPEPAMCTHESIAEETDLALHRAKLRAHEKYSCLSRKVKMDPNMKPKMTMKAF